MTKATSSQVPRIIGGTATLLLLAVGGWMLSTGSIKLGNPAETASGPASAAMEAPPQSGEQAPAKQLSVATPTASGDNGPALDTPAPARVIGVPEISLNAATERDAAQWALDVGGNVEVRLEDNQLVTLSSGDPLPAQSFTVSTVELPHLRQVDDQSLANLKGLSHLNRLDLSDTAVTSNAAMSIRLHPWLTVLNVPETAFGDSGLEQLATLTRRITSNAGIARLGRVRFQRFDLSGARITDAGLLHLAACEDVGCLLLDRTTISDAGLPLLAGLQQLRELSLRDTRITDRGVETLARMKSLTRLWLSDPPISQAAYRRLKEALPNCKIYWSPSTLPAAEATVLAAVPEDPVPHAPFDPGAERRAAEWALAMGGQNSLIIQRWEASRLVSRLLRTPGLASFGCSRN